MSYTYYKRRHRRYAVSWSLPLNPAYETLTDFEAWASNVPVSYAFCLVSLSAFNNLYPAEQELFQAPLQTQYAYGYTWHNGTFGEWEIVPEDALPVEWDRWEPADLEDAEKNPWLNQFSPVPTLMGVPYDERNGTIVYAQMYDIRDTHDYWGWRYFYLKEFDLYTRKGSRDVGGIAPILGGVLGLWAMAMLMAGSSPPKQPGP